MSQSDRAIKKFATQLARLDREVKSWRGAQADFTSIENGGNFTFKDGDGNVTAIMGGQDDGSNTIRHVDGPTPPVPSGLSAHVDGPIVQVSWDGTFESNVTHDWHYLEVLAVGPNNEQLTGTINDLSGGETSLAATAQGDWVLTARSVSRAGKRSLDGDAGTVVVQLVGLTGAIDAVQESANGKNTIYYSPTEPTPPELGFNNGDLWFDTSEEGNNTASVWDGNGWVSMEDARLATIIAAQEALESDLEAVQESADGKNTITWNPDAPTSATPGTTVGDTWFRTSGNNIIGYWRWDGSDWVEQSLDATVIPNLDAGKITSGFIGSERIEAGSITADKVLVESGRNMLPWGQVERGETTSPHYVPSGYAKATLSLVGSDTTLNLPPHLHITIAADSPSGMKAAMRFREIPQGEGLFVGVPGVRYRTRVTLYSPDGVSVRLQSTLYRTPSGGFIRNVRSSTVALTSEPQEVSLDFTMPSNGSGYNLVIEAQGSGIIGVVSPELAEMIGATLIEDGAITTDKLAVGSITAESGVIASLDLGKATVGELDGVRIMGQTIRGEQLSGDAIDGKVITGPTIQSGRSGRRWIGDPNGIRIINEDDDVRTQLSPDGSTFKGEVEADTLVVNDGAEFKGNNTLAQGAKFTLAAGVTDPTAPPVVQPYWEGVEFDYPVYGGQESTTDVIGLAFDGTNYWTVKKSGNWGDYPNGVFGNAARINATTGATTGFAVPFTNSNERFGVTCIGSELFWLYRSGYEGRILVTDLNLVKKRETPWNLGYSKTNPLTYKPGIGNDGTNIVIAHCTDSGRLDIHTCNKTTGAIISTVNDSADLTRSDITGVYVGNADWGRKLVTVAKKSAGTLPSFSATTGVFDGVATQFNAASPDSTGVVYVDGKFHTLDPSGVIHEYADVNTGDGSGDWWAAYYWYNWISVLLSNRSRISPPSRFTWPRRAKLKVMGAPLPVGVNRFALSLAKKTTTPTRTDFHNVGSALRDGQAVAYLNALSAGWADGSVPPDGNDFPEAESSVLQSSSGTFQVKGDGSGHWGPLTMGRNGVMSGLVVSAEVLVTPSAANTPTKFTVTLPPGRFAKPPIVWVQLSTSIPHLVQVGCYQPDTPATFDLYLTRYNTSPTGVTWFAMDRE